MSLQVLTLEPFAFKHSTVGQDLLAFAVFFVRPPNTFVVLTVRFDLNTETFPRAVDEATAVLCAIGKYHDSFAVDLVVQPLAVVGFSVRPDERPGALHLVVEKFAFVDTSVGPGILAFSVFEPLIETTGVC